MPSICINGPDGSQTYSLDRSPVTIGRAQENALVLKDEELSRRHCVLERSADGWQIRDLGSRNGVTVNGARVSAQKLSPGDVIRIGGQSIRYGDEQPISAKGVSRRDATTTAGQPAENEPIPLAEPSPSTTVEAPHRVNDASAPASSDSGGAAQSEGLVNQIGWSGIAVLVVGVGLIILMTLKEAIHDWTLMEWIIKLPLTVFVVLPLYCLSAMIVCPLARPLHKWWVEWEYGDVVAVVGTKQAVQAYKQERWFIINCGHFFISFAVSFSIAFAPMFLLNSCWTRGKTNAAATARE